MYIRIIVCTERLIRGSEKKCPDDRAAGRVLFSICLTWLQAAANDHDLLSARRIPARAGAVKIDPSRLRNASPANSRIAGAGAPWMRVPTKTQEART
jgi:hypothetical protein